MKISGQSLYPVNVEHSLDDGCGYHVPDASAFNHGFADVGGTEREKWGFEGMDPGRQIITVNGETLARIDKEGVVFQNFFIMCPMSEYLPIVSADKQTEPAAGIGF